MSPWTDEDATLRNGRGVFILIPKKELIDGRFDRQDGRALLKHYERRAT
jgi:hypothetical protein